MLSLLALGKRLQRRRSRGSLMHLGTGPGANMRTQSSKPRGTSGRRFCFGRSTWGGAATLAGTRRSIYLTTLSGLSLGPRRAAANRRSWGNHPVIRQAADNVMALGPGQVMKVECGRAYAEDPRFHSSARGPFPSGTGRICPDKSPSGRLFAARADSRSPAGRLGRGTDSAHGMGRRAAWRYAGECSRAPYRQPACGCAGQARVMEDATNRRGRTSRSLNSYSVEWLHASTWRHVHSIGRVPHARRRWRGRRTER